MLERVVCKRDDLHFRGLIDEIGVCVFLHDHGTFCEVSVAAPLLSPLWGFSQFAEPFISSCPIIRRVKSWSSVQLILGLLESWNFRVSCNTIWQLCCIYYVRSEVPCTIMFIFRTTNLKNTGAWRIVVGRCTDIDVNYIGSSDGGIFSIANILKYEHWISPCTVSKTEKYFTTTKLFDTVPRCDLRFPHKTGFPQGERSHSNPSFTHISNASDSKTSAVCQPSPVLYVARVTWNIDACTWVKQQSSNGENKR